MHKTVLITPPTSEPITLEELQAHLKVDGEDDYLNSLIITVRKAIERYLKRSILTQTWKVYADCWHDVMKIPSPPLQSVTSVKYFDINGSLQTLDTENYWVVTTDEPGYIQRGYDVSYPELQYGRPDSVEIEYVAGWEECPEQIKHAIKIWCTDLYEHRGELTIGAGNTSVKIPNYIANLIHDFRIYKF